MAQSRYNLMGTSSRQQYEEGAVDVRDSVRSDVITAARYTSWLAPEGSQEYVLGPGESLTMLAETLYGDQKLWWVIADFNPQYPFPLDIVEGSVLKLPSAEVIAGLV